MNQEVNFIVTAMRNDAASFTIEEGSEPRSADRQIRFKSPTKVVAQQAIALLAMLEYERSRAITVQDLGRLYGEHLEHLSVEIQRYLSERMNSDAVETIALDKAQGVYSSMRPRFHFFISDKSLDELQKDKRAGITEYFVHTDGLRVARVHALLNIIDKFDRNKNLHATELPEYVKHMGTIAGCIDNLFIYEAVQRRDAVFNMVPSIKDDPYETFSDIATRTTSSSAPREDADQESESMAPTEETTSNALDELGLEETAEDSTFSQFYPEDQPSTSGCQMERLTSQQCEGCYSNEVGSQQVSGLQSATSSTSLSVLAEDAEQHSESMSRAEETTLMEQATADLASLSFYPEGQPSTSAYQMERTTSPQDERSYSNEMEIPQETGFEHAPHSSSATQPEPTPLPTKEAAAAKNASVPFMRRYAVQPAQSQSHPEQPEDRRTSSFRKIDKITRQHIRRIILGNANSTTVMETNREANFEYNSETPSSMPTEPSSQHSEVNLAESESIAAFSFSGREIEQEPRMDLDLLQAVSDQSTQSTSAGCAQSEMATSAGSVQPEQSTSAGSDQSEQSTSDGSEQSVQSTSAEPDHSETASAEYNQPEQSTTSTGADELESPTTSSGRRSKLAQRRKRTIKPAAIVDERKDLQRSRKAKTVKLPKKGPKCRSRAAFDQSAEQAMPSEYEQSEQATSAGVEQSGEPLQAGSDRPEQSSASAGAEESELPTTSSGRRSELVQKRKRKFKRAVIVDERKEAQRSKKAKPVKLPKKGPKCRVNFSSPPMQIVLRHFYSKLGRSPEWIETDAWSNLPVKDEELKEISARTNKSVREVKKLLVSCAERVQKVMRYGLVSSPVFAEAKKVMTKSKYRKFMRRYEAVSSGSCMETDIRIGGRKTGTTSSSVEERCPIVTAWFYEHLENPVPTPQQLNSLARRTKITTEKVSVTLRHLQARLQAFIESGQHPEVKAELRQFGTTLAKARARFFPFLTAESERNDPGKEVENRNRRSKK